MIADAREWRVEDHVCRDCMGRVLRCGDAVMCAQCGREEKARRQSGRVPTSGLCCCGLSEAVGATRTGKPLRQPFRCQANPLPSPSNSSEIISVFGDLKLPTAARV